jgi:hypothetical protein
VQTSATPLLSPVTEDEARDELAKFFAIAKELTDEPLGMFSKCIDAQWHRLAETADYSRFCMQAAGQPITHAPINGEGEVTWLPAYHERFGALTPAWFADEDGSVDSSAYGAYLDTQTVRASWNCQPTGGDDGGFQPSPN